MNLLICKRCKEAHPEDVISPSGWCANCRARYSERLSKLGKSKAKRKMPPDSTSIVPRGGIEEVVRLARLAGQLKTQALISNNKWKWKQFFDNEVALRKEVAKWKT